MGKQGKMKQQRRFVARVQVNMGQVRQKWLGKTVSFDLGRGEGVQLGRVVSISNEGDVIVESLPGYDAVVPGLALSIGFLDQVLTLVEE